MGRKRNAVRYNSVGLFLTDSPASEPSSENLYFFNRVQSVDLSVEIQRQNVQHIGSEDFLDRKIVAEPEISLKVDYLLTDGYEEKRLGLNVASASEPNREGTIYSNIKEDKSVFIAVGQEDFDLTGYKNRENGYSGTDVIGIGNCYVTSYSISAGVGELAKASVSMVASNLKHSCYGAEGGEGGGHKWLDRIEYVGLLLTQMNSFVEMQDKGLISLQEGIQKKYIYKNGAPSPSLDLGLGATEALGELIDNEGDLTQLGLGVEFYPVTYKSPVSAIPPGGINITVRNLDMGGGILSGLYAGSCIKGSANIQNFAINLPFSREDLHGFGSMHPYGRKIKYPQIATMSMSMLASSFDGGDLRSIFCEDEEYEIEINLNNQCDFSCAPSSQHDTLMKFTINNAKLDSYSFGESIGSLSTVDCNFSFGVSRNNGLFISGSFDEGLSSKHQPRDLTIEDVSLDQANSPLDLKIEKK